MEVQAKIKSLKEFFDSPLGSQIKYYALFYFVLWSAHLILISLISYFHLLLNHNIRTIGDWIGDRGWALIILSKVLIFYLALQFIRLKSKKIEKLKSYFRNSIQRPRREIFTVLIFLLLALSGLARLNANTTVIFEIDRVLYSIIGTFIFFSVDYVLLIILDVFFPIIDKKEKKKRLFIFPLLFYYFTYATFIYEQIVSFKLYAFFLLLLYLGEWRRRNWTVPLLFLITFLIPCYAFFGLDPVWSSTYTYLKGEREVSTLSLFILIAFAMGYLFQVQKSNPEHIYRD